VNLTWVQKNEPKKITKVLSEKLYVPRLFFTFTLFFSLLLFVGLCLCRLAAAVFSLQSALLCSQALLCLCLLRAAGGDTTSPLCWLSCRVRRERQRSERRESVRAVNALLPLLRRESPAPLAFEVQYSTACAFPFLRTWTCPPREH